MYTYLAGITGKIALSAAILNNKINGKFILKKIYIEATFTM